METITGKFHQNPLKTVGGVAETRLFLRMEGRADKPITIRPLRQTSGDNVCSYVILCSGLKNELEISVVNKPLMFEPLKFYCSTL